MENTDKKKLKVAVVGCLHGKLKDIYDELADYEIKNKEKIDFLICCGDFQVNSY
jgi:lariat debranching enzyme